MIIRRHGWALLVAQEYEITTIYCPRSFEFHEGHCGDRHQGICVEQVESNAVTRVSVSRDVHSGNGMRRLGEGSDNGQELFVLKRTIRV